jgi:hypothetical protein
MTTIQTTQDITNIVVTDGVVLSNSMGGASGSVAVANMFRDAIAGVDSLDIIVVGDSNTLFYSGSTIDEVSGWTDGFTAALWKVGASIYGTPIFPLYLDASTQSQGWRCLWTSFAGGIGGNGTTGDDGITSAYMRSGNLGTRLSGGGTVAGPAFCTTGYKAVSGFGAAANQMYSNAVTTDYAWFPSGEANRFQDYIAGLQISATHPMGVASSITYRVVHATFASGGGSFTIRCQDTGGSQLRTNQTISCAGSADSIGASAVVLNADAARTLGIQWRWAGEYGARATNGVNGKFAGFLQSAYKSTGKGVSVSALCWSAGSTMTTISTGAVNVGTGTLETFLNEARSRQVAAGGTGRVVILIHGGANADSGEPASWVTAANLMKTQFETAWDNLRFPASQLGFLMMPSHPKADPDDLTSIRSLVNTTYAASSNSLAVDLGSAAQVSRLKDLQYYDAGSGAGDATPDVHLSPVGYLEVAQMALSRILAQGT